MSALQEEEITLLRVAVCVRPYTTKGDLGDTLTRTCLFSAYFQPKARVNYLLHGPAQGFLKGLYGVLSWLSQLKLDIHIIGSTVLREMTLRG